MMVVTRVRVRDFRSHAVGDVALGPAVYRWLNIEIERPELPNLQSYHERLAERPAYQKSVMVPFTLT